MLKSDGMYSNFWCGMTEEYYYLRTEDYKPILQHERIGCFHVPMVHSSVLIDLHQASSNGLTFMSSKVPDYKGPHDDIITFALAANKSGEYNIQYYILTQIHLLYIICKHHMASTVNFMTSFPIISGLVSPEFVNFHVFLTVISGTAKCGLKHCWTLVIFKYNLLSKCEGHLNLLIIYL